MRRQVTCMPIERRTDPSTTTARIVGPIDVAHFRETRRILMDCLQGGDDVLVDMSGVTRIDGAGLANLIQAHRAARKSGQDFALFNVSDSVKRSLKLVHLDQVFTIFDRRSTPRVH